MKVPTCSALGPLLRHDALFGGDPERGGEKLVESAAAVTVTVGAVKRRDESSTPPEQLITKRHAFVKCLLTKGWAAHLYDRFCSLH